MIKKVVVLLMLLLTLSGCAAKPAEETEETAAPTTQVVQTGKYDKDNRIEAETNGTVKAFALEQQEVLRMDTLGKHLLVFAREDAAIKLMLLSGEELLPLADTVLAIDPKNVNDITVLTAGIAFYEESSQSVVYLDALLKESSRVKLPKDVSGKPFVAATGEIYYTSDNTVRQLDPDTNIPRLIRQLTSKSLTIIGCYFEGEVLACRYTDSNDVQRWCYISSKTGATLSECDNLQTLVTEGNAYFATRDDGLVHQMIFGTLKKKPRSLNISREMLLGALPALNGSVLYKEKDNTISLSFCDYKSGKCRYGVSLNDIEKPSLLCSSTDENYIWFWAKDLQTEKNTLYRWEYKATPQKSKKVYTGTLYTAKTPDEKGLEKAQKRVDTINQKYGVTIRIWQNAVKVASEYSLTPEHQVSAINSTLTQIEEVLKTFPLNFFWKTGRCTNTGTVRICIVRAVDAEQKGAYYWDKDGDFFIALTPDCNIRDTFLENLGYVVMTHVMGNSVEMDYWTDWNPKKFTYGEHNQDDKYLTGDRKAFLDKESMYSVTDDRSRMLLYAMTELGEGNFESHAMQGKLKLLSLAIRDTYRLRSFKDVLPWEQYLKLEEEPDKK